MKNRNILIGAVVLLVIVQSLILIWPRIAPKKAPTKAELTTVQPLKQDIVGDSVVEITENGFNPATVTVKVGTRVRWTNKTEREANVSSDDFPSRKKYSWLNVGDIPAGKTEEIVVRDKGTFTYHNYNKPSQKGTLIVR